METFTLSPKFQEVIVRVRGYKILIYPNTKLVRDVV